MVLYSCCLAKSPQLLIVIIIFNTIGKVKNTIYPPKNWLVNPGLWKRKWAA